MEAQSVDSSETSTGRATIKGLKPTLLQIVEKGDVGQLNTFLTKHRSLIDQRWTKGQTLLWLSSRSGQCQLVSLLLSSGATVDTLDKKQRTPLWVATSKGQRDIVELLLKHGANPRAQDRDGRTPFWIAIRTKQSDIAELLRSSDPSVLDIACSDGTSPLWVACAEGYLHLIEYLVHHDADPRVYDKHEHLSPLFAACAAGHVNVVAAWHKNKELRISYPYHDGSPYGRTLLHVACRWNQSDMVKFLVEANIADATEPDEFRRQPLWYACFHGNTNIIWTLLSDPDIDIGQKDSDDYHPLWVACQCGNVDAVKVLVSQGADVNAGGGPSGLSPLEAACHFAPKETLIDMILLLLSVGATPPPPRNIPSRLTETETLIILNSGMITLYQILCVSLTSTRERVSLKPNCFGTLRRILDYKLYSIIERMLGHGVPYDVQLMILMKGMKYCGAKRCDRWYAPSFLDAIRVQY